MTPIRNRKKFIMLKKTVIVALATFGLVVVASALADHFGLLD